MKRETYFSDEHRQTFAPSDILLFPYELIIAIVSFVKISSSFAFAITSKTSYTYYERYCGNEITVVPCDSRTPLTYYNDIVKALYEYIPQYGWARLKLVPILNFQNANYPMGVLCLNETLSLPNGVNGTDISDLIIASSLEGKKPTISFGKFANLKTLGLRNVSLNSHMTSIFSHLKLLEFISLYDCDLNNCDLSDMFANCISLEELQIKRCKFPLEVLQSGGSGYSYEGSEILLPPKLKTFKMQRHLSSRIDASQCTRFHSL
jgi:hypothetical protein